MGYFWQDYWAGLPFPPPEALLDPGIDAASPESPALAGGFFTTIATWASTYSLFINLESIN